VLDGGFDFWKTQGGPCKNLGPNCNYFSKAVDRGLILEKLGGSLAKTPGEPVCTIPGRWISIGRLRFDGPWI
jgi:hypothetical protein